MLNFYTLFSRAAINIVVGCPVFQQNMNKVAISNQKKNGKKKFIIYLIVKTIKIMKSSTFYVAHKTNRKVTKMRRRQ